MTPVYPRSYHEPFPGIRIQAHWQRFDGWDRNDPDAPRVWQCYGCDLERGNEVEFCPDCGETTSGYML